MNFQQFKLKRINFYLQGYKHRWVYFIKTRQFVGKITANIQSKMSLISIFSGIDMEPIILVTRQW